MVEDDTIDADEGGKLVSMISKKKTELVEKVYKTAHPRAKDELFYRTKDGRWKSKNPQFIAKTREELICIPPYRKQHVS